MLSMRPKTQKDDANYHAPWCEKCHRYVEPRVMPYIVAGTEWGEKKFCPHCGERVQSQHDLDHPDKDPEVVLGNYASLSFLIIGGILLLLWIFG